MNDLTKKLTRNAELEGYLNELSELMGRKITEKDLSALEEVEKLKNAAVKLEEQPKTLIVLAPEELKQARFSSLVQRLAKANPNPVSVWLNATSSCGTFYLSRIDKFNFSFRFDAIPEGVIALLTEDGNDELLLDFSPDEVEVELQGAEWGSAEY